MLSALVDAYLARVQVLLDAGKHDEARDLAHELAESLRRHVEAGACLPVRREVLS